MGLFSSDNPKEAHHSGILGAFSVDNIKWEPGSSSEAEIVVKKFPYEDFPNGSYLTVAPSQMAVFVNNMASGSSMDTSISGEAQIEVFSGGTKIKLETGDSRFAPFRNVTHKLTGGESAFHSVVYFINTTYMNDLTWGTQSPILIDDPIEEVSIHVRANGMFGVHIEQNDPSMVAIQARKFLNKIVGTQEEFTRKEITNFMRQQILREVPTLLGETLDNRGIGILKISSHLNELSTTIYERLKDKFDEFGMTLDDFSFNSILPLEEDLEEVKQIKIQRRQAKFEAERRALEAQGTAAQMTIESEALAAKRAREGYSYQQERGFEVMQDAAQNEGTGSNFMNAGMGLGMGFGIGGAFGSGMQGVANATLGAMNMGNPMGTPASATTTGNTQATGSDTKICPDCGSTISANAKFCPECGKKFEQGVACPGCGNMLPIGAKFCPECGMKMISKCPSCGNEVTPGAKFCPECGTSL